MEKKDESYEWPGWPLKGNPHGDEFDLTARKRMIAGSEVLLPFIYQYKKEITKFVLEVGPFFNPLITPKNFPGRHICYWENDLYVLKWLSGKFDNGDVNPIFCNLNNIEGDSYIKLKKETFSYFNKFHKKDKLFDSIIISQVLNYIDYKLFFVLLKSFIKKDGLIFINNVIDYGIPAFFSEKRPKSLNELTKTLKELGYEIVEKEVIKPIFKDAQKENRVILVLRNRAD